jgi:flagellar basal body-associated protein FliL
MTVSRKFSIVIFMTILMGTIVAGASYAIGMFDETLSAEEEIARLENKGKLEATNKAQIKREKLAREFKSRGELKEVYWRFNEPLLANVYRSAKFIQVDIAFLVKDNSKGELSKTLKTHEFGIRNQMLNILSSQQEEQIASKFWRKDLAADLKNAANDFLVARTGLNGVEDVYFGKLVVQ